ncbi:GNAT family N-acetyltransferase [Flammeovirgaceae bacterium SG7u.111]|nr:GNAT family N-acetyltransferase [Flammeovirgaceae bacterium SG7u.132]WPO34453.1 GNAT family N-acetyltransferase [Flammeovirgaceae bacterium SG7u.111]
MNYLKHHKPDSNRFGLNIYRSRIDEVEYQSIVSQIVENNVDVAIVRLPTPKLSEILSFEKLAMPFIVTDTLAYYHKDLAGVGEQELINKDVTFELAGLEQHKDLNFLVRETFGNYVNHYRVNPFFDNQDVTEGYMDWMQSYAEGDPNRLCWIVRRGDKPVGFGTFNFETEGKVKGILYGVLPSERRTGLFTDIMRYAQNYALKEREGIEFIRTITQIENIAVQKLWTKEGFTLHHTTSTIHINALLDKSVFNPFYVPFIIKAEERDSEKISNRHILKQINWQMDFKQNMVTKNHRFVNIEPMHSDEEYELKFSFPMGNKGLVRVTDTKGKTYALVYFDVRHFLA